jgi:hypothetical protein
MKIQKLENGFLLGIVGQEIEIYRSEAWELLLKLAEGLELGGLILGMLHILKEDGPECSMRGEHDQIWFGGDSHADDASDDMKAYMDMLGWFIDEDSWSHFV